MFPVTGIYYWLWLIANICRGRVLLILAHTCMLASARCNTQDCTYKVVCIMYVHTACYVVNSYRPDKIRVFLLVQSKNSFETHLIHLSVCTIFKIIICKQYLSQTHPPTAPVYGKNVYSECTLVQWMKRSYNADYMCNQEMVNSIYHIYHYLPDYSCTSVLHCIVPYGK